MLTTESMERAIVLAAVSRRSQQLRAEEMRELARLIREEIVEAWNKGR